jgi:Branched-chain amino acid transport system / permease component
MTEVFLTSTIAMATPILLAALGELIVEESGVVNIGIEGAILAGAFFGLAAAYFSGSLVLGLLAAIAAAVTMNALLAALVVNLAVNQVVAGTALNILVAGLTGVFYRQLFGITGKASSLQLLTFRSGPQDRCACERTCFRALSLSDASSSLIPDSTTGGRSGNSATSDRLPPMASTVFRSVDSRRSLRFSRRETLSWVTPRALAMRICVSLRALRSSRKVISSAINSAARASTFLRRAGLNLLILSFTSTGMITFLVLSAEQDGRRNDHRLSG